jgi:hypothetical protein
MAGKLPRIWVIKRPAQTLGIPGVSKIISENAEITNRIRLLRIEE